ncbi:hypothetical protein [Vitiosangium sp. GDMCC 1.1324]|uniref:hypothetical protein n=1 Tax=Vitiosangium sp. (strain GDMCC 1.1324) TaxID=2138576 RepID=UPI000D3C71EF|nr:hypothetical protein [Vitiosangium sp. GDMCC 1.1324]PTL82822.1 hypothetical protein DAT35_18860 [Vitiosangium sp. GDMCC 1.1324]
MPRTWWVLAGSMTLTACVGVSTPGRGTPSHYALDSLTNACRQDPKYCATLAGKEVASGPVQTVGSAVASGAAVLKVLSQTTREDIETELKRCADEARSEVILRYPTEFKGQTPSDAECKQWTVDAKGRWVTWAMRLGTEMHDVALGCINKTLSRLRKGGYSLDPCYRYDKQTQKTTFVSCEEVKDLLDRGCGDELRGTLRPDLVLHSGNPLDVQAVYDFKFPCVNSNTKPEWRDYPETSPHYGCNQGQLYQEALGVEPEIIFPRWGLIP